MIEFTRPTFNKAINTALTIEKKDFVSKFELVRLGTIANVAAGNSAPQDNAFFSNGTYPFFRVSDVAKYHLTKDLTECADYLNEQGIKGLRLFPKGTILFPKSGASTYKDHRAILGVDGYVVSHLATINVISEDAILTPYLYEVLTLIKAQEIKPNSGYPSLNASDLENVKIPIPPMDIQQQIVAECQKVDEEYNTSRMSVEDYRKKIAQVFENLQVVGEG